MPKDDKDRTPLGLLVRQFRIARGMSQADLVRAARGLTTAHLGLIESGERSASESKVEAIADALGLSPSERRQLRAARSATVLAASGATPGMTDEQRAALVHDIAAEVVKLLREQGAQ